MATPPIPIGRNAARCPRCGGRLMYETDRYGAYLSCLTCGCTLEETAGGQAARDGAGRAGWWGAAC